MEKDKAKKQLEERLQVAFKGRWQKLSLEEKEYALEKFYEHAWLRRVAAKETLAMVTEKRISFGVFVLGLGAALVFGLVVNVIHDSLKQFTPWYQLGVAVLAFAAMWWITRLLEELINQDYRDNNFLDELLEGYIAPEEITNR